MKMELNLTSFNKICACLLLVFALLCTNSFAGINDGLVAYYPFNGNANDESGNGNDGILQPSSPDGPTLTEDRSGNPNSAYNFDGNDYVNLGQPVPQDLKVTTAITIAAWVHPFAYPATNTLGAIVANQHDSDQSGYSIMLDGRSSAHGGVRGGIHFQMGDGTSYWTTSTEGTTATAVPLDEWTHIAATWSSGESPKVYLNGDLVTGWSTWNGPIDYSSNNEMAIGAHLDFGDRYFNGLIDDVRIYNRALTEPEIQILYNPEVYIATISGSITCAAYTGGAVYVQAFDGPDPLADNLLGSTEITSLGSYTIENLPLGEEVWVSAFWDKDVSGGITPNVGDYIGEYASNPVTLLEDNPGIDIDLDVESNQIVITQDLTIASDNTSYEDQSIIVNGCTVTIEGHHQFEHLSLINGAVVTHHANSDTPLYSLDLTINGNLSIDATSAINAEGKGYPADQGPGAGGVYVAGGNRYGSGGGYGGAGGPYSTVQGGVTYGSATAPIDLGSGGGYSTGGAGGGAIRLVVTDTLTVNGSISANGANGIRTCGGSGGSVYLTVQNLTGTGEITADGGNAGVYTGGGGGGRIAVSYETSTHSGIISANGGSSSNSSYYGQDGTVGIYDAVNNDLYIYDGYIFHESDSPFNFNNIVIADVTSGEIISEENIEITAANLSMGNVSSAVINDHCTINVTDFSIADGSNVEVNGSSTLTITNLTISNRSSVFINGSSTLNVPTISIESGSILSLNGSETINASSITVAGEGSQITHASEGKIDLSVPLLTIGDGASINAEGKGYSAGQGPGAGGNYGGSGGGYGGEGGPYSSVPGGGTYGSATAPTDLGSGGGNSNQGGAGGGAIRLIVTDTLTVNGRISASGNNASAVCCWYFGGGGSGGSVYLTVQNLVGAGEITADGGDGSRDGGGGGGGRIAISYESSTFSGAVSANGGTSTNTANYGQDGTIFVPSISNPFITTNGGRDYVS